MKEKYLNLNGKVCLVVDIVPGKDNPKNPKNPRLKEGF